MISGIDNDQKQRIIMQLSFDKLNIHIKEKEYEQAPFNRYRLRTYRRHNGGVGMATNPFAE
jgi:hypothetical protein